MGWHLRVETPERWSLHSCIQSLTNIEAAAASKALASEMVTAEAPISYTPMIGYLIVLTSTVRLMNMDRSQLPGGTMRIIMTVLLVATLTAPAFGAGNHEHHAVPTLQGQTTTAVTVQ